MKRNLFLTLILSMAVSTAYAEEDAWITKARELADSAEEWSQSSLHTSESHKPEEFTNLWDGTHTIGNWVVTKDTATEIIGDSVLNIGCYTGAPAPASLAVQGEGVKASTGNCLFVGGKGYTNDEGHEDFWKDKTAQEGFLTVRDGATLTVGTATTKALGAQLNVGEGEGSSGHMLVEGTGSQAISNAIMSVGASAGSHGDLVVDKGATVTVQATSAITDYGTALHVGAEAGSEGHITIDNGSALNVLGTQNASASLDGTLGDPVLGAGKATTYIGQGKGTTGDITVKGGSTALLEGTTYLGYDAGSVGVLTVQDKDSYVASEGMQLGIAKDAKGTVNVESGAKMQLLGTVFAGVGGQGTINVTGEGTQLNSTHSIYTGSAGGSEGTLNISEGAAVNVESTGVVYIGRSGENGKGTLNNNGTLNGETIVNGNGELHGSGTFGATTVKDGGKVFVGDKEPVTQTYTGDMQLQESTTTFSVTDLTLPSAETQEEWVSNEHSLIKMAEGTNFSITEKTKFIIDFCGEELPAVVDDTVNLGDFTILLVEGGVDSNVVTSALCDTLLGNTTFSFTQGSLENPVSFWATTIDRAHYLVANNNLYLVATSIPEPATATLSLLALAALAARRRRK